MLLHTASTRKKEERDCTDVSVNYEEGANCVFTHTHCQFGQFKVSQWCFTFLQIAIKWNKNDAKKIYQFVLVR